MLYERPSVKVCRAEFCWWRIPDAHQRTTTERAVADLAPFVFRRSHVQTWTYIFLILTNSFCEKFRDNSRKYVGSADVFFRLVTYKSLWNVALYKKTVWEKWRVCPRNSLREVACLSKKQFERSGVFVQETVWEQWRVCPRNSLRAVACLSKKQFERSGVFVQETVWEKWRVCPRNSYNFRRLAPFIIR